MIDPFDDPPDDPPNRLHHERRRGYTLADEDRAALEAASAGLIRTAADLRELAAEVDPPDADAIEARRRLEDACHDCGRLHDGDCQQEQVP